MRWVETRAAGVSLTAVAAAMDRLGPSPDRFHKELGKGRDPLANIASYLERRRANRRPGLRLVHVTRRDIPGASDLPRPMAKKQRGGRWSPLPIEVYCGLPTNLGRRVCSLFLACYAPATRPDRRDGDEITAHAPKNGRLNVLPKGIRCSRHRAVQRR